MVNVLPEVQGFGSLLGRNLGAGLGQGVSRAADFASQMAMEKAKMGQRQKMIQGLMGASSSQQNQTSQEDLNKRFLDALPEIENKLGRDLTPQDLDQIWGHMSQPQQQVGIGQEEDPFAIAKALALYGEPEIARVFTEEAKSKQKRSEREIERGYEESKPTRTRGREILEDLPYKENALLTMQEAIKSGNIGMFSLDNLAETTGIEGLRSPEGAAFKTASKEFFLGNLSRVGAKGLNQMMESVVLEMSPLIGRKTEANLAVTEILGAENDVVRKEAELIHDIGQEYKEKYGHYPDDLADRVYKQLRPYAIERQKEALAKVDEIKEMYEPKNKSGILMYDPAGNLRRVPHKDAKTAMKEGYRKQ